MKKRKILYLAAAFTVTGALALTGCGEKETKEEVEVERTINYKKEPFEYYIEEPEEDHKDPYEHLFFIQYRPVKVGDKTIDNKRLISVSRGSVTVPDGYIPIGANGIDYMGYPSSYTETKSIAVWFTNVVPVVVHPIFNEDINAYDYSTFGTPVELEEELETSYTLK